jgi:hypothetical protein
MAGVQQAGAILSEVMSSMRRTMGAAYSEDATVATEVTVQWYMAVTDGAGLGRLGCGHRPHRPMWACM